MVFSKLILEYDVGFEGVVRERPPRLVVEGQFVPNLGQRVRLRRRVDSMGR